MGLLKSNPVVTLAEKLGVPPHLSPLLHKAERLGLDAEGLEAMAVSRGCSYYQRTASRHELDVPSGRLSNEELAIALLNPALRYHPQTLRLGAAMLGARGNDAAQVARLARLERCESVVAHVAQAGRKFEPADPFWPELLALLPARPAPKPGGLPHETRLVAMTGLTRNGVETIAQWIRPVATQRPA